MKTIFWNVDTQYDFMRPDGKLYVKGAEQIEGNLARLTQLAESRRIKVVNTADWHNKDSEELSDKPDFVHTFPEHCMQDTYGAGFIPATYPYLLSDKEPYIVDWKKKKFDRHDRKGVLASRSIILHKDKFDIFAGNPHADRVVELLAPERAVVYGVATNVCVDCAVRGLLERKVQVYVPLDAIKEIPALPLPYDTWKSKGAILTTTDEIYKILGGRK